MFIDAIRALWTDAALVAAQRKEKEQRAEIKKRKYELIDAHNEIGELLRRCDFLTARIDSLSQANDRLGKEIRRATKKQVEGNPYPLSKPLNPSAPPSLSPLENGDQGAASQDERGTL